MKKALLALTIASLTAPAAMATEFFIGGGLGYHSATLKINDDEFNAKETASGAAFSIRGGAYIAENHRVTATINFSGDHELFKEAGNFATGTLELAQTEYLVSYDYIHAVGSNLSIFGGATAGMVKNELSGNVSSFGETLFDESRSETDFLYGLQAGVQYKLTDSISADLQYRYMFESYSESFDTGFNTKVSVPNSSEFTISLDYRF
ncbi:outer membrane protein [Vibrio paucivorans]